MAAEENLNGKKPDPTDIYVGSRIRMQRNLVGMSQTDLGNKIGLTFQQVQKYEKGTNRVGASRLRQISEALGVPVAFFFEGDTNSNVVSLDKNNPQPIMDFLGTRQGLELNRAFLKITDPKVRDRAVQLLKALAENSVTKN